MYEYNKYYGKDYRQAKAQCDLEDMLNKKYCEKSLHSNPFDEMENLLKALTGEEPAKPQPRRRTLGIKKVVADKQNNVVVVYFKDGTKEVVKMQKGDHFDVYVGASLAITKHIYGNTTKFYNEINKNLLVIEPKKQEQEPKQTNTKKTSKKEIKE